MMKSSRTDVRSLINLQELLNNCGLMSVAQLVQHQGCYFSDLLIKQFSSNMCVYSTQGVIKKIDICIMINSSTIGQQ